MAKHRWLRRRRRSTGAVVALFVALLAFQIFTRWAELPEPFPYESGGEHAVERVVDGDTLLLKGGTRVRLLGVDTPETKHPTRPVDPLGLEAAEFAAERVEGRRVRLEFDRERKDRFGRVLAYVYLGDWFLNEELIRAGYSEAETHFPYSAEMKRRFVQAEEEARAARRGGWEDGEW